MTAFSRVSVLAWQLVGVLLFLFIPLVLFLFVRHPRPLWASLVGGIVLMLGHRFAARPYMLRVLPAKCVWCNRWLPEDTASETVPLFSGSAELPLRTCPAHALPTRRFFGFLRR